MPEPVTRDGESLLPSWQHITYSREITPEQFSPVLSTQLMAYFFAGQPLTGGAKSELRMLWSRAGNPGGNFDWYVQSVIGANLYGVGQ